MRRYGEVVGTSSTASADGAPPRSAARIPVAPAPPMPAATTRAPAPSPNSTAVARSSGSTSVVNRSAPITRALVGGPTATMAATAWRACTNPQQAPFTSNAAASMPSTWATRAAVDGHAESGVAVATTTRSICSGSSPAAARARAPASAASAVVVSAAAGSATWRARMPVRAEIHSSLVSKCSARSSLVIRRAGRAAPAPRNPSGISGAGRLSTSSSSSPAMVKADPVVSTGWIHTRGWPGRTRSPGWARVRTTWPSQKVATSTSELGPSM